MTRARPLPADTAQAATTRIRPAEWDGAGTTHERFKALVEERPAAKRRRDATLAEIDRRQVTLRRLREARSLTQAALANSLGMDQSEISRLERRTDLLLSTLRRFVRATGGEMRIVVSYPDGEQVELDLDIPSRS
jgi:septal ring factor EnvC (AmiA/AmiB activator)